MAKVNAPTKEETGRLRPGATVVGRMRTRPQPELLQAAGATAHSIHVDEVDRKLFDLLRDNARDAGQWVGAGSWETIAARSSSSVDRRRSWIALCSTKSRVSRAHMQNRMHVRIESGNSVAIECNLV